MEEKKKKESIDEILSDLNGLLNKMPSILDGIKMPELQPAEPPKPASQPEPAPAPLMDAVPGSPEADKTVVLPPFSGLQEGAPAPLEIPTALPSDESDKTVVLEPFAGISSGEPAPGDAMPEDKREMQPEPQPEPQTAPPQEPAPEDNSDKTVVLEAFSGLSEGSLEPQPEVKLEPAQAEEAMETAGLDVFSGLEQSSHEPQPAAPEVKKTRTLSVDDSTRDFGIPDIDALMQMSEGAASTPETQETLPEAGVIPEALHAIEQQETSLPTHGLFQEAESSQGESVEPAEKKEESPAPLEAAPLLPEEPAAAQEAGPSPFDSFTIDASAQPETGAAGPAAEQPGEAGGLGPEPQAGASLDAEAPQPEAQPQEAVETLKFEAPSQAAGITLEPQAGTVLGVDVPQPEAQPQEAGGLELSPAVDLGPQPGPEAADQTMPGGALELGPAPQQAEAPGGAGLELSVGTPTSGGEETLVVSPTAGPSSGEEEKTVIFQAAPSTTSRAQAGDLAGLAAKTVPPGIPDERVRSLMFLYSPEDKALCATVLAELDSICLKSATKPMFVKRASVAEFDADANSNFIQQSVQDSGAQGLVCLGSVPQEKIYELDNLFGSSGGFFRYYDSSSFNHSAALDLVVDLILR